MIEAARARLAETRERETAATARVAEGEADLARLRIEQAEADSRSAGVREEAHARELDISRRQQQQEFNRHQVETLAVRAAEIATELEDLRARQEPARLAVSARADVAAEAGRARDAAVQTLAEAAEAYAQAQRHVETVEADVDAARRDVFAASNAVTALRHVIDHAASQRERVGETLGKLDVEQDDHRRETESVSAFRASALESLSRAKGALEQVTLDAALRESELAVARSEHEARLQSVRAHEQELARVEARLSSLMEIEASRGEFGDAARMVLVQANGRVGQRGAVADYLDVDRRYERAVEACLGDLLQHVVVERHDQAAAGLALVREHDAGRCGFVVIDPGSNGYHPREALRMPGIVPISDVLRVAGPHVVNHPEGHARSVRRRDVRAGSHDVAADGGAGGDHRWRSLQGTAPGLGGRQGRVAGDSGDQARDQGAAGTACRRSRDIGAAHGRRRRGSRLRSRRPRRALMALTSDQHRQEMAIVSCEGQVTRAIEEAGRLERKAEVIALERRQAEEEQTALDARHAEAESSVGVLLENQRVGGRTALARRSGV